MFFSLLRYATYTYAPLLECRGSPAKCAREKINQPVKKIKFIPLETILITVKNKKQKSAREKNVREKLQVG